ncbi:SET and MYND domain-containing protein 4 [Echria macrotheca]|uniref:SET and MYND domain-containing protein 4 n=1 Tax=Echria macrotheca TaxID=438768 RepID=A0AAJ0BIK2_9PEZI|nr:SET and MYND domain-containing protein 4 [Echria macrotheca]
MAVTASPATEGAPRELVGALPPRRLTKEELLKTHKAYLKKQDLTPDAPRPVKQPVMAEAYPASTKSIRDVEIIPLTELRVETHHRGKGIIVKVASPPFVGAGAVSVVEDEFGNADKLAIYNQGDTSILSGVPEGCVVAVKEPYYRFNGSDTDYMICVDHPSDVILLRFTDPIIPEPLRLGPLLKTATDWKKAGDTAFLEKDFPTAIFCYSEALEESNDKAFKAPVYTKRAGTNLLLGRYDAAMSDSLASRIGGPSDWKAYYNAGRAAYGLCEYRRSREYLEKALELNEAGTGVRKEYERCLARLREEETGDYDFAGMHKQLSTQNVHMDHGSFLRRTAVKESGLPGGGRGLFATEDIPAGELILVEKATLMPNQYDPSRASPALFALMVRQLCDNPSLARTILPLYAGDYARTGAEGTLVDGVPVVDIYLVENIRTKNCFSLPPSTLDDTKLARQETRLAKGLWAHASYMNHSCVPNSMRSFVGDMLISRATRDIRAGDEITHQYVPVKAIADVRAKLYRDGWGFDCTCPLCAGERDLPETNNAKRRAEALAAVEKVCNKRPSSNGAIVPDSAIRTVDRLARQLEDAHEVDVYAALPRLMLIYPSNWLVSAHRGRKNWTKVLRYGTRVLRNFGFVSVPLDEDAEKEDWDPMAIYTSSGKATLMTVHVVAALRRLAQAYGALGREGMAERCTAAAGLGYKMVTGWENDMTGVDKD